MKLNLLPPSVNKSDFRFCVQDAAVIYGLGAVRGVGEGPVEAIVAARQAAPFRDLADFCQRLDTKKVNKRVLEALINAGAMDDFMAEGENLNQHRAQLLAQIPQAMQGAEQVARDAAAGMTDLFGGIAETVNEPRLTPAQVAPMSAMQRLNGEKDALGLFLTGHPIDSYEGEIRQFCRTTIKDLRTGKQSQWVAGMVVSQRVMKTKRGTSMAFLVLDDRTSRLEVSVFSEAFEQYGGKISKDALLVVEGEIQHDEYNGSMALRASRILTIDEARQRFSRVLHLDFSSAPLPEDFNLRLKHVVENHRAAHQVTSQECPIVLSYQHAGAVAKIALGEKWRVQVCESLLQSLAHSLAKTASPAVLKCFKTTRNKMVQELTEILERSLQEVRVHAHGQRGRVFVALSGGADSTALLHSAQALLHGGDELYALHADHQLHAKSGQWRSHCQALCRSLGVPLIAEA